MSCVTWAFRCPRGHQHFSPAGDKFRGSRGHCQMWWFTRQTHRFHSELLCACKSESHSVLSDSATPWNIQPMEISMGSLSLLQGIFPTQGSDPGLSHCRRVLYQLRHKASPRILEWVAYPFSGRSFWPGIEPGSRALQVDSLPAELSGKMKFCAWSYLL